MRFGAYCNTRGSFVQSMMVEFPASGVVTEEDPHPTSENAQTKVAVVLAIIKQFLNSEVRHTRAIEAEFDVHSSSVPARRRVAFGTNKFGPGPHFGCCKSHRRFPGQRWIPDRQGNGRSNSKH